MTAEEIKAEAALDAELSKLNQVIRARLIKDADFRKELHERHERVIAERREEPEEFSEWIGVWRMLLASSPTIRKEGQKEVRRLIDGERDSVISQIADPAEEAPKKKQKIVSEDDEEDEDFGAGGEY